MAAEQRAQQATGEPRSRRTPAATADDAATLETAGVPGADEESATLAQMAVAEDMPGLEVDVGAVSSADTESSYPQHAETEPSDPEHVQHPNVGKKGTAKARRPRKKRRLAKEKAHGVNWRAKWFGRGRVHAEHGEPVDHYAGSASKEIQRRRAYAGRHLRPARAGLRQLVTFLAGELEACGRGRRVELVIVAAQG